MRAAIYNPYLDTLGGGERYTVAIIQTLVKNGFSVDIEWSDSKIITALEKRFDQKLINTKVVNSINKGSLYDVCFWISDGSIPLLSARKNFLHFQFPFKLRGANNLINKMKLYRIHKVICNSNFTKGFIDASFGINSEVLYPPVSLDKFRASKKENVILYVGRFSKLTQNKGHEVLIENFKKFSDISKIKYKLILAGGSEIGSEDYLKELKESICDYPIEIIESPGFLELKKLYSKAQVFWSASGFGIDESLDPTKVEHFGITPVEAMASGAIPVLFNAGGHKEIINNENGFLWKTSEELIDITIEISTNSAMRKKMSKEAIDSANQFSYVNFEKKFSSFL